MRDRRTDAQHYSWGWTSFCLLLVVESISVYWGTILEFHSLEDLRKTPLKLLILSWYLHKLDIFEPRPTLRFVSLHLCMCVSRCDGAPQ